MRVKCLWLKLSFLRSCNSLLLIMNVHLKYVAWHSGWEPLFRVILITDLIRILCIVHCLVCLPLWCTGYKLWSLKISSLHILFLFFILVLNCFVLPKWFEHYLAFHRSFNGSWQSVFIWKSNLFHYRIDSFQICFYLVELIRVSLVIQTWLL